MIQETTPTTEKTIDPSLASNFISAYRDSFRDLDNKTGRGEADLTVQFQELFSNQKPKVSLVEFGQLTTDDLIEFCICWASMFLDRDYIINQMQSFSSKFGKVFPEDDFYHARMSYFIELFVLDHILPVSADGSSRTSCYYAFLNTIDDASKSKYRDLLYSIGSFRHSLFRVKKQTKNGLIVADAFADVCYEVKPKQSETLKVMVKGTVFQGIVFPIDKIAWLGQGMIVHSSEIWSVVQKKIKATRKLGNFDERSFLQWLATKQILAYRHKKVDPALIYSEKIYASQT